MGSKEKYKFESTIEVTPESPNLLKYLYSALYPDLFRECGDPFSKVEIKNDTLTIYLASNSQARFIGIINTVIRLIAILEKLYYMEL